MAVIAEVKNRLVACKTLPAEFETGNEWLYASLVGYWEARFCMLGGQYLQVI